MVLKNYSDKTADPDALYQSNIAIAQIYEQAGDYEPAHNAYKEAESLKGLQRVEVPLGIAATSARLEDYAQAEVYYDKAKTAIQQSNSEVKDSVLAYIENELSIIKQQKVQAEANKTAQRLEAATTEAYAAIGQDNLRAIELFKEVITLTDTSTASGQEAVAGYQENIRRLGGTP